jgi:hypothetical protein
MVHADTKQGFTGSLNHTNVKNTSTDDGDKPEKVYKYDNRDGLSVLDSSQESSPHPVRVSDVSPNLQVHLTSACQSSYYVYDNNSVS